MLCFSPLPSPIASASLASCFTSPVYPVKMHRSGWEAASPGSLLTPYGLSGHSSGPSSSNGDDLLGNTLFPHLPAQIWQGSSPCSGCAKHPGGGQGRGCAELCCSHAEPAPPGQQAKGVQPLPTHPGARIWGSPLAGQAVPCVPPPPGPRSGAVPGPGAVRR